MNDAAYQAVHRSVHLRDEWKLVGAGRSHTARRLILDAGKELGKPLFTRCFAGIQ